MLPTSSMDKQPQAFYTTALPNTPPPSKDELLHWRQYNYKRKLKRYQFYTGFQMVGTEKLYTLVVFDTYLKKGQNLIHNSLNKDNLSLWNETNPEAQEINLLTDGTTPS